MSNRVIMRIEVEPESKEELDNFCDRTGMTKVASVSRLIDWFCTQPESVQAIVQGLFPSLIQADAVEIILKQLTAQKNIGDKFKLANGNRIETRSFNPRREVVKSRLGSKVA